MRRLGFVEAAQVGQTTAGGQNQSQPDGQPREAPARAAPPEAERSGAAPRTFDRDLERLRRLANTYEAHASARPTAADRRAAAYVAGTAHQLLSDAARLGLAPAHDPARVTAASISAELAAVLLFLTAGYPSDALEAARRIDSAELRRRAADGRVDRRLVAAVVDLARARLARVAIEDGAGRDAVAASPDLWSDDLPDPAADALWALLLAGVRRLAVTCSAGTKPPSRRAGSSAGRAISRQGWGRAQPARGPAWA
jgi:hypothetical protein